MEFFETKSGTNTRKNTNVNFSYKKHVLETYALKNSAVQYGTKSHP